MLGRTAGAVLVGAEARLVDVEVHLVEPRARREVRERERYGGDDEQCAFHAITVLRKRTTRVVRRGASARERGSSGGAVDQVATRTSARRRIIQ